MEENHSVEKYVSGGKLQESARAIIAQQIHMMEKSIVLSYLFIAFLAVTHMNAFNVHKQIVPEPISQQQAEGSNDIRCNFASQTQGDVYS